MRSPKRRGCDWRPGRLWSGRVTTVAFVALALAAAHCGGAAAQTLEEFYSGRQIKFVVGSAGGGGYEFYSRLLGRYMSSTCRAIRCSSFSRCRAPPA